MKADRFYVLHSHFLLLPDDSLIPSTTRDCGNICTSLVFVRACLLRFEQLHHILSFETFHLSGPARRLRLVCVGRVR
jgi:hypothetical protein